MKIFISSLLAVFLVVSVCAGAMAQGAVSVENEGRFLESELILASAKKANIYFIFNLKTSEILLKARGVVLKEMKIEDMKIWGNTVDALPRQMLKKSALFKEPKRVSIDPNKAKEETTTPPPAPTPAPATSGEFEIDALELKDMPTIYHLEFNEGVFISVRPKGTEFKSKLYSIANYVGWYVSRPVLTILNSIKGRPFTSIYLVLSEADARSVYWSLVENSENIIYQP